MAGIAAVQTPQDSAGIPGPSGSMPLAQVRERPLDFLQTMHERYGDLFRYEVDGEQVVVANHPALVGTVLRSAAHHFTKERTPDHYMLSPLLGNGLLTSNGPAWVRQRKALAPLFRPSEVTRFDDVIVQLTQRLADTWVASAGRGIATVDVEPALSGLTLEILVRVVFGRDLAGVGSGFGDAVTDINHFIGRFRADEIAADPEAMTALRRYLRGAAVVRAITDALIDTFSPDDAASGAFMRRMTDLVESRPDLHDQVLTLIMAGHETTAKTMLWALYLLAVHPDQQARLTAEIDAAHEQAALEGRTLGARDVPRLRLAAGTVQEAMRLFPPVWLISRRAQVDTVIGDHLLREGDLVCVSPWLLHRDERWWAEPESFRPDRFDQPAEPFTYVPFGGGERVCIGQHLALLEATLALATLVRTCRVTYDGPAPDPEALVTLRPRAGMPLQIGSRA